MHCCEFIRFVFVDDFVVLVTVIVFVFVNAFVFVFVMYMFSVFVNAIVFVFVRWGFFFSDVLTLHNPSGRRPLSPTLAFLFLKIKNHREISPGL